MKEWIFELYLRGLCVLVSTKMYKLVTFLVSGLSEK